MFKKRFLVLCSALIIASATVTPTMASAHHGGGHHGGRSYARCTVTDCNKTGRHYHNGNCYYGHTSHKGGAYCSNSYHH